MAVYTARVITPPSGWTQHFGAHLVTLYPPEGGGRIRFYERIRPMQSTSQIIRMVLDKDPAFRVTSIQEPLQVNTAEGEYGVWVRVNGTREGAPAVHFVGAVFADEFAAALDTLVVLTHKLPMLEAVAKELLGGISLGLGQRRRRFLYQPPERWQAIPSGLVANWYPPDFPANNTNIVVYPADTTSAAPPSVEAFLAGESARGFVLEGSVDETEIESVGGLSGQCWRLAGRRPNRDDTLYRDLVTFCAHPYSYSMRMETYDSNRLAEHRALFAAVARSSMPIPTPGRYRIGVQDADEQAATFMHWID